MQLFYLYCISFLYNVKYEKDESFGYYAIKMFLMGMLLSLYFKIYVIFLSFGFLLMPLYWRFFFFMYSTSQIGDSGKGKMLFCQNDILLSLENNPEFIIIGSFL